MAHKVASEQRAGKQSSKHKVFCMTVLCITDVSTSRVFLPEAVRAH